jgi:hexosaminidase
MSWTGVNGGIEAAKSKHFAVMTPGAYCYFDHYQGDPQSEPNAFGGFTPLDKVYSYNPIPSELNAEQAKYIMGVQANLWTEYILDFKQVQYMIFQD